MSAPAYGDDLAIPFRFRGPSRSGNGGYTAGSLAERVGAGTGTSTGCPVVEVTLRQPPPLDVPMKVQYVDLEHEVRKALLLLGGSRIAEARLVDADLEPVDAVSFDEAQEAMTRYSGLGSHPFPSCFACGPDRSADDGLRIFPGPVQKDRVTSLWTPHPSLAEKSDVHDKVQHVGLGTTWAALDCVGGWASDTGERRMVLGRMTAQVDALPLVSEPHLVVGTSRGTEGRKTFTASTLYDSDSRIVGRAEHTWIAIDPSAFS